MKAQKNSDWALDKLNAYLMNVCRREYITTKIPPVPLATALEYWLRVTSEVVMHVMVYAHYDVVVME